MNIKFKKCLCSHGIILCAYVNSINPVAEYIPLYGQFVLIDREFAFIEKFMRAVHFDHQTDEIDRFRHTLEFKRSKGCR